MGIRHGVEHKQCWRQHNGICDAFRVRQRTRSDQQVVLLCGLCKVQHRARLLHRAVSADRESIKRIQVYGHQERVILLKLNYIRERIEPGRITDVILNDDPIAERSELLHGIPNGQAGAYRKWIQIRPCSDNNLSPLARVVVVDLGDLAFFNRKRQAHGCQNPRPDCAHSRPCVQRVVQPANLVEVILRGGLLGKRDVCPEVVKYSILVKEPKLCVPVP